MLGSKECFKNGRVDRDALKGFIKDIKKNTKLSDEDAAVIAASKVCFISVVLVSHTKCFYLFSDC